MLYQSSKGPVEIDTMPLRYARNALAKLTREHPERTKEINAIGAHVERLEAEAEKSPLDKLVVSGAVDTVGAIMERGMGDNNPPADTPFERVRDHIETLYMEAGNWLDGTPIASQEQADDVGRLVDAFRKAHKEADTERKTENEPFDKGKAEVQGRYNPILKRAKDAEDLGKRAIGTFLAAQQTEQRRQAAEAQRIADQQAAEARQAVAEANRTADLAAKDDAENLVKEAAETAKLARVLDSAKPMAETGGRRMGLRSVWTPTITDRLEAMRSLWRMDASAFDDLLLKLAQQRINGGMREIAGFAITETHIAR